MTSKEALETVKDYLLQKLKEDNSELGSIIIVESVNVLEELVVRDTPDKPLLVETSTDNVHHYECLYCGATINIGGSVAYNKKFNIFCRECGQRLDWSELDD